MASQQQQRRCHYEVLGVDQHATSDEIRVAYRKLALTWHPDKNQHRVEEATLVFKEIQAAYEILSDKHERAWYDDHRESILRSGASDHDSSAGEEFEMDLWPLFSSSAFSGFGDTGDGFYAVYGSAFEKVYSVEVAFSRRRFGDEGEGKPPPSFGGSGSKYEEVCAPFYNYWLKFATCKDFAWRSEYNLSEAPNRKIRRLMEAENAKVAKKARAEFNEMVRELAAFVKKRDKRVVEYQLEEKKKKKEREEEARKRREEQERERIAKLKAYVEPEWARGVRDGEDDSEGEILEEEDAWFGGKVKGKKGKGKVKGGGSKKVAAVDGSRVVERTTGGKAAKGEGEEDKEEEEEEEEEEFFCVVCDKDFKSAKQLANHERSKKHLERLEEMRAQLLAEEEEFDVSEEGSGEEEGSVHAREGVDVEVEREEQGKKEQEVEEDDEDEEKNEDDEGLDDEEDGEEEGEEEEDEEALLLAMLSQQRLSERKSSRKKEKKKKQMTTEKGSDLDRGRAGDEEEGEDGSAAAGAATEEAGDEERVREEGSGEEVLSSRTEGKGADCEGQRGGEEVGSSWRDVVDDEQRGGGVQEKKREEGEGESRASGAGEGESGRSREELESTEDGEVGTGVGAAAGQKKARRRRAKGKGTVGEEGGLLEGGAAVAKVKIVEGNADIEGRSDSQAGGRRGKQQQQQQQHQQQQQQQFGGSSSRRGGKGRQKAGNEEESKSCGVCGAEFDSRNKLFKHISSTGHAQPRPAHR